MAPGELNPSTNEPVVEVEDLEPVWRGLANPVRRRILDHLRDGPKTTGDLALLFPGLSRFAVMQHLEVLVEADLVVVKKSGRLRFNHLNAVPIRRIYERWVSRYAGHWSGALLALQSAAESRGVDAPAGAPATDSARAHTANREGDRK